MPVPGSAVDFGKGIGAQGLLASLDKPPVYIQASTSPVGLDSFKVTLSAPAYPGGELPAGPVTYRWDFSDGTSATGQTVTHEFQTPGQRQVAVTVTTVDRQVAVKTPLLVDVAFDNALVNLGGSGGTLAWVGTPSYAAGKTGAAASFKAGTPDLVTLSNANGELAGMEQLTLSFDFRSDGLTAARPLWVHTAYGIAFDSNGTINLFLNTGGGFGTVVAVKAPQAFDGKWHTLSASYDSVTGAATLFLDGAAIGSKGGLSGRVVPSTRPLTVGADNWGKTFNGQIDNLHIYRAIVPPAQEPKVLDGLRQRKGAGLFGDDGANQLAGAGGDDTLVGGLGADHLKGDAGNDTFLYRTAAESTPAALDTIAGFDGAGAATGDVIDVSALGSLSWIGAASFSGGRQLRVQQSGSDVLAQIDSNGDRVADWQVLIQNASASQFTAADFIVAGASSPPPPPPAPTPEPTPAPAPAPTPQPGSGPTTGNDSLTGTAGSDVIDALAGNDTVEGLGGHDVLTGGAGNDRLFGGDGNDTLIGGAGDDLLDGGAGTDSVSFAGSASAVVVNLLLGTATGDGNDTLVGVENVTGSAHADKITGDAGNNWISGGLGDDTLEGGFGLDTVSFADAAQGVSVNLLWATATGQGNDVLRGFETVNGSNFNDTITGDGGSNMLIGGRGDDVLDGGVGNDTLLGGAGNDTLIGGSGIDVVHYGAAPAGVTVNLTIGTASGDGSDTLISIESVTGSKYGDLLIGDLGNNTLTGDAGNDTLDGGDGNDNLNGGAGEDLLISGRGRDILYGGEGADRFRFQLGDSSDDIRDFEAGIDKIELSGFGISSWDQLAGKMFESRGITTIFLSGSDVLKLTGVTLASLSADDFIFHATAGVDDLLL
ncbi:MAG: PKD domain-containing protein [Rhodospirillales bacterium]|nr:PKD domain-containing protein [Rhodospirillales bacterium]